MQYLHFRYMQAQIPNPVHIHLHHCVSFGVPSGREDIAQHGSHEGRTSEVTICAME